MNKGGFMPRTQGDSPSGRRAGAGTTRPLTIASLLKAERPHPDAEFSVHGKELGSITIVGIVRIVISATTQRTFTIEDGTGQVDVRQWSEQAADEEVDSSHFEGKYIRVMGMLKTFNNKRHVIGQAIHVLDPMTDPNAMAEILFHTIDTEHTRMCLLHGLPKGRVGASTTNQNTAKASDFSQQISSSAVQTFDDAIATVRSHYQKDVMRLIGDLSKKGQLPSEGLNIGEIMRKVAKKGYSLDDVRREVNELVEDGFLYTTHDDDHVMPT